MALSSTPNSSVYTHSQSTVAEQVDTGFSSTENSNYNSSGSRATAIETRQQDNSSALGYKDAQPPRRVEGSEPILQRLSQRVQSLEKLSAASPVHGLSENGRNMLTYDSGQDDTQILVNKTRIDPRWKNKPPEVECPLVLVYFNFD